MKEKNLAKLAGEGINALAIGIGHSIVANAIKEHTRAMLAFKFSEVLGCTYSQAFDVADEFLAAGKPFKDTEEEEKNHHQ